jgi:hypothetical protein
MSLQTHAGLHALIDLFNCEEINEKEWALLQAHMAYCHTCEKEVAESEATVTNARLESAAREGKEAKAGLD